MILHPASNFMFSDCEFHSLYIQDGSAGSDSDSAADYVIEPLPGLETIVEELSREDGYDHFLYAL